MKAFGIVLILGALVLVIFYSLVKDDRKRSQRWDNAPLYHVTSSQVLGDAKVLHLVGTDSVLIVPAQMNPNVAMIRMIKDDRLYFRLYNGRGNILMNGESYTGVYLVPPHLTK